MKRGIAIFGCLCLAIALAAAPAAAKKKKKPPSLGPVTTVTSTGATVGIGNISTATAVCPAGTQAVGGGWIAPFSPSSAAAVYESYRSTPNAWTVSGVIGIGTANVTTFGYCRKVKGTISDRTGTATLGAGTGAQATASATCPAGTKLISGGLQSTQNATSVGAPQDNYSPTAGVWTYRASNSAAGGPHTITAHAYCMAGLKAPRLLGATTTATVPAFGNLTATTGACPKAKKKKKKGKKGKKAKPRRLSAGGFSAVPGPTIAATHNLLEGTRWRVTALSQGGSTTLNAQGICA